MTQAIETANETIPQTLERLGLTVNAAFVPFSQSRNAKPNAHAKDKSLNWRVTLCRDGRPILLTDYMAGIAHCPSYKQNARWTLAYDRAINFECDEGRTAEEGWGGSYSKGKPILPETASVIHSLLLDASVLDYSNFEDWASEFGYDADSRSAEKIYRACLEIALQLRNGLGESVMAELQTLFRDY